MILNKNQKALTDKMISDDFFIFDNFNESGKISDIFAVTNHPVRMNINFTGFCIQGFCRIKIGLEEYVFKKKHLFVILSKHIFQVLEISPDFKVGIIMYRNYFANVNGYLHKALSLHNIMPHNPYYQLSDDKLEETIAIFNLMKNKLKETDNLYRYEIIQSYSNILFYNTCNRFLNNNEDASETQSHEKEVFESFIRELHRGYQNKRNIIFYAEKLCLTPKYLSSIVKRVSGKSAGDWIATYTILEAEALLKSTSMTIQQISDELNFPNQSHFGRYFKKHTGLSPKSYRREDKNFTYSAIPMEML